MKNFQDPRDRQTEAKVLRLFSATTKQYTSKEKCIKWLHKVGTFSQGFKDWRKIKKTAYQNVDDLQKLLAKLTVKARAEFMNFSFV